MIYSIHLALGHIAVFGLYFPVSGCCPLCKVFPPFYSTFVNQSINHIAQITTCTRCTRHHITSHPITFIHTHTITHIEEEEEEEEKKKKKKETVLSSFFHCCRCTGALSLAIAAKEQSAVQHSRVLQGNGEDPVL